MSFTSQDVVSQVRALAAERPDFVYTDQPGKTDVDCGYAGMSAGSMEGEGCIVGQALERLGVSKDILFTAETENPDMASQFLPNFVSDSLIYEGSHTDTAIWLNYVQQCQDDGKSWGASVELADERYK